MTTTYHFLSTYKRQIKGYLKNPHFLLLSVSTLLLVYTFSDHSEKLKRFFLEDSLYHKNQIYLNDIERRSSESFVKLAAINAISETLESSQVGFSLIIKTNITIGKELNNISKLSKTGYQYAGLALTSSIFIQTCLIMSHKLIPQIYRILLILTMLYAFSGFLRINSLTIKLFIWVRLLLICLFVLHIVVPYSVHLAGVATNSLSESHLQSNSQHFRNMHNEFSANKNYGSTRDHAKGLVHRFEYFFTKADKKIESLLWNIVRYIVVDILTTILIPIGLACLFYILSKQFILRYIKHPLE